MAQSQFPPAEFLFFLPPVDGVLRVSEISAPFQIEQAEFDAIWGMLLFEKKIDFTLTSVQLNVPKYHLLRVNVQEFSRQPPVEFKLTATSIELLEDKDLTTFFAALKDEFSRWQTTE